MNNGTKSNVPLYVGLAIPFLMILFVTASIYLPRINAPKPKYNFLYAVNDDYYYRNMYVVENGKLSKQEVQRPKNATPHGQVNLYLHDVNKDMSQLLSFEQAQALRLEPSPKSPDGFEVVQGTGGSDFLFFFSTGYDYNTLFLVGPNSSKKLDLQVRSNDSYTFRFLGWVLP